MLIGREALAEKDGGGDRVRGAYLFPYLSAIVPIFCVRRNYNLERENLCKAKEEATRLWGRRGRSSKLSHVRMQMQCNVAELLASELCTSTPPLISKQSRRRRSR
jgi:hypothetical protein